MAEAITIVIPGSISGLKNAGQIHQRAADSRVSGFLREKFGIDAVPCYYWLLCLLKSAEPVSLNHCFLEWVKPMRPESMEGMTVSLDGKTIRFTEKTGRYECPPHIVSAQIPEPGMTFARKGVESRNNESPAVQNLLEEPDINGCIIAADASNARKNTAKAAISKWADYLLSVEDNQAYLKQDVADYEGDAALREMMDTTSQTGKSRDRTEKCSAYITEEACWLYGKEEWAGLRTGLRSPRARLDG